MDQQDLEAIQAILEHECPYHSYLNGTEVTIPYPDKPDVKVYVIKLVDQMIVLTMNILKEDGSVETFTSNPKAFLPEDIMNVLRRFARSNKPCKGCGDCK